MEIVIIYIWAMLVTTATGMVEKRYKGSIYVPRYFKILLLLPYRKGEEVPIYLIIIHVVMQLATIVCIICLIFDITRMNYSAIQKMYGLLMGVICSGLAIICRWIFRKK